MLLRNISTNSWNYLQNKLTSRNIWDNFPYFRPIPWAFGEKWQTSEKFQWTLNQRLQKIRKVTEHVQNNAKSKLHNLNLDGCQSMSTFYISKNITNSPYNLQTRRRYSRERTFKMFGIPTSPSPPGQIKKLCCTSTCSFIFFLSLGCKERLQAW